MEMTLNKLIPLMPSRQLSIQAASDAQVLIRQTQLCEAKYKQMTRLLARSYECLMSVSRTQPATHTFDWRTHCLDNIRAAQIVLNEIDYVINHKEKTMTTDMEAAKMESEYEEQIHRLQSEKEALIKQLDETRDILHQYAEEVNRYRTMTEQYADVLRGVRTLLNGVTI